MLDWHSGCCRAFPGNDCTSLLPAPYLKAPSQSKAHVRWPAEFCCCPVENKQEALAHSKILPTTAWRVCHPAGVQDKDKPDYNLQDLQVCWQNLLGCECLQQATWRQHTMPGNVSRARCTLQALPTLGQSLQPILLSYVTIGCRCQETSAGRASTHQCINACIASGLSRHIV